jgi:hypothetical protein
MAAWSEPQLAARHDRLHKDNAMGEFHSVQRCTKSGEWQISVDIDEKRLYFSILDQGENHFKMLDILDKPRTDCSGPNEGPAFEDRD